VDVRPKYLRRSLSQSQFTFEHVVQQDQERSNELLHATCEDARARAMALGDEKQ
jgi:hypothetical protein